MMMMTMMMMVVMMMFMMFMMFMMLMMIMDHIQVYIYILKVHRHGISKIRNVSAIPVRSNVRVAPNMFLSENKGILVQDGEWNLGTSWVHPLFYCQPRIYHCGWLIKAVSQIVRNFSWNWYCNRLMNKPWVYLGWHHSHSPSTMFGCNTRPRFHDSLANGFSVGGLANQLRLPHS